MSKSKKNYKLGLRFKEQSQRQLRVAQIIKLSLMEALRRETRLDPILLERIPLSISEVIISPDLQIANCFFTLFNTNLNIDDVMESLEKSRKILRNYVTKQVNLKYSPDIRFFYDETYDNQEKMQELINQANAC